MFVSASSYVRVIGYVVAMYRLVGGQVLVLVLLLIVYVVVMA